MAETYRDPLFGGKEDEYDPKEDGKPFGETWKQRGVELGLLGALALGTGHYVANGNTRALAQGAKDSMRTVGRAFDRYIKSRGPLFKLVSDVVKNTPKKLAKMPGTADDGSLGLLRSRVEAAQANIDTKKIQGIAKDRYYKDLRIGENEHKRQGLPGEYVLENSPEYYVEKVKEEELDRIMNPAPKNNRAGGQGSGSANGDRPSAAGRFIGAGLSGLGFGAGLTAFHGVDGLIRGQDDNRARDRNFHMAGSFSNRGAKMDKRADFTRALHDSLLGVGARTPQAIATGIGYTGVSLGTAKLLKDHPELLKRPSAPGDQQNDNKPSSSRIIIELGDDTADPTRLSHRMDGYTQSPRFASADEVGMDKHARLRKFLKDFAGRFDERHTLQDRIDGKARDHDYRDQAIENLKSVNMEQRFDKQVGHLKIHGNERELSREIIDSEMRKLKRHDEFNLRQIEDSVKRARVIGVGGLAGLAATGGTISHFADSHKERK